MTLVERLADVKKRLDTAACIEGLRPEDAQQIIIQIIRDCQRDGAEEEREACRKTVRSVADELHPERDHIRWSQWTSAIEEAEKRIRARSS